MRPDEPNACPHLSPTLPIAALPEIRDLIDGAEGVLKADISRIKKLLADPAATLPPTIVAFTLQEAKDALDLLGAHSRQLTRWQKETPSATTSVPRSCACRRSCRQSARCCSG